MMTLRPYQAEAVDAILHEWDEDRKRTLLVLPTGCHAIGQKLLMADGTAMAVEDIHVGDKLMGSDGSPRTVLHRTEGNGQYFCVKPVKGDPFLVTGDHKLTLVRTNERKHPKHPCQTHGGEWIDVTVREWLSWSDNRKHLYKLVRCAGIDWFIGAQDENITIAPYFLGILLGDGYFGDSISVTTAEPEVAEVIVREADKYGMHLRIVPAGKAATYYLTCGLQMKQNPLLREIAALGLAKHTADVKFVPTLYKYAPRPVRLEVIAGLIDSDGYLTLNGYDYITKSKALAEDLAFMCRSVGLAAYISWCWKTWNGKVGDYYRVSISGQCDRIPCRVQRRKSSERRQSKDVLRTGFQITPDGYGPYIGFTVDGDNRYLLEDFTVTHNCGKTIVFAMVAKKQVERGHRVLILAHRGELLQQAADKLKMAAGLESVLEKAESSSIGSFFPVTVGSVQSLAQEKRLAKFPADYFDDIIVDEAHHCLSASYQKVLNHFPAANVLGVTATPDRGDMKNLGEFFDSRAYEYTMTAAIRQGFLVPIKAQMIPLQLDLTDVGISSGDFAAGDIGNALEPYLEQIANEMLHYCYGRKTVVFLPLIATSQKFCQMLNAKGLPAAEVNGDSDDRAEVLSDFEAGKYAVLCNSMLLTEGWDCPAVDCIVVLRPTKVRGLYQQMVGRGMRLSPGKDHLLLLDFLWMTERHDLCRPSALISKNEEIARKMDEQLQKDDGVYDLIETEEQAERDVLSEREAALARELAEMRRRKAKLVDPLQYALSIAAEDLANYVPTFAWEMGPPSEKQLKFLEARGIQAEAVENSGKAHLLIDRLIRRQNEGLATPKQIRLLERYGFQHVGTWSFEAANDMISRLSNNGWRLPRGIYPATYNPSLVS